jgi:D-xylose transport system substrate-binding protein
MSIVENALTANGNKIDAVVASNDATAGGAIQALAAQKLDGKVAGVGPGLRPGRGQARDRRHAGADRLQAAEADRHRSGQAVGAAGAQSEAAFNASTNGFKEVDSRCC